MFWLVPFVFKSAGACKLSLIGGPGAMSSADCFKKAVRLCVACMLFYPFIDKCQGVCFSLLYDFWQRYSL